MWRNYLSQQYLLSKLVGTWPCFLTGSEWDCQGKLVGGHVWFCLIFYHNAYLTIDAASWPGFSIFLSCSSQLNHYAPRLRRYLIKVAFCVYVGMQNCSTNLVCCSLQGFAITLGIALAVWIITMKGPNPYMKIVCFIMLSFAPVGIFESSFNDADDPPENRAEPWCHARGSPVSSMEILIYLCV